jgi:hypothetical protein
MEFYPEYPLCLRLAQGGCLQRLNAKLLVLRRLLLQLGVAASPVTSATNVRPTSQRPEWWAMSGL